MWSASLGPARNCTGALWYFTSGLVGIHADARSLRLKSLSLGVTFGGLCHPSTPNWGLRRTGTFVRGKLWGKWTAIAKKLELGPQTFLKALPLAGQAAPADPANASPMGCAMATTIGVIVMNLRACCPEVQNERCGTIVDGSLDSIEAMLSLAPNDHQTFVLCSIALFNVIIMI